LRRSGGPTHNPHPEEARSAVSKDLPVRARVLEPSFETRLRRSSKAGAKLA
jgi:hypothetical protein